MPMLEIEGKRVEVDDSFLKLSPEAQEAQVEEIATQLRGGSSASQPKDAPNTNFPAAIVDSAARGAKGVLGFADRLAGKVTGLEGDQSPVKPVLNALQGVQDWANYARPEGLDAATIRDQWNKGEYLALAKTALQGGAYSAVESIPDVAMAMKAPIAALAGNTETNLEARQANNGGRDLTGTDVAAAAAGALGETVLDRFAGRMFKGGPVKAAAGGVATDAGSGVVESAATQAGTDKGYSFQDAEDAALESAVFGAAGGLERRAVTKGASELTAPLRGKSTLARTRADLKTNRKEVLSDARILKAVEEVKRTAVDLDKAGDEDGDSAALGTVLDQLKGKLRSAADTFLATGLIDRDTHKELIKNEDSPVRLAERHNRLLTEGALESADKLPEGLAKDYKEAVYDLDRVANNRLYKRQLGPFARAGGTVALALGAKAGATTGLPGAAYGGAMVGRNVGERLGAKIDRGLGLGRPRPIINAERRAPFLDQMGITVRSAGEQLESLRRDTLKYFGDIYGVDVDSVTMARLVQKERIKESEQRAQEEAKKARAEEQRLAKERAAAEQQIQELSSAKIMQARAAVSQMMQPTPEPDLKEFTSGVIMKIRNAVRGMNDDGDEGELKTLPYGQISKAQRGVADMQGQPQQRPYEETPEEKQMKEMTSRQILDARKRLDALVKMQEAQRLAAENAEKQAALLAQQRQASEGALEQENGTPRGGGWYFAMAKNINENFGVRVQDEDYLNGLKTSVDKNLLSKSAAEMALQVHGAQIKADDDPDLYYKVQDEILAAAVRRAGLPVTRSTLLELQQNAKLGKAREQGRLSVERKEGAKQRAAELRAERNAQKAPRVTKTRKAKERIDPQTPPEGGLTAQEQGIQARRNAVHAAAIEQGKAVEKRALDTAPNDTFAQAAINMAGLSSLDDRKALYDQAVAAAKTPQERQWLGTVLYPVTLYGDGGLAARTAHVAAFKGLHDPTLVTRTGNIKKAKK